jgi:hypothetical protein
MIEPAVALPRFINEYSFPIALLLLGFALALALPVKRMRVRIAVTAAVMVVLLAGYAALRPGAGTVGNTAELDQALASAVESGRPVFIEVFSNG